MSNDQRWRIHTGWVIADLLLVIIVLLTVDLGDQAQLADRLMFALALASLVLALVAIIYTFFRHSNLTQTIGRLTTASTEISSSAEQVQAAADELRDRVS